jgi:hypothetical protein
LGFFHFLLKFNFFLDLFEHVLALDLAFGAFLDQLLPKVIVLHELVLSLEIVLIALHFVEFCLELFDL